MTARGPGASNRTAGLRWQRACAAWLRDHGYPLAMSSARGADMVAGPVAVEATIADWRRMWVKLDQAEHQAMAYKVPYGIVWRKKNREPGMLGSVDPALGCVVMRADRFWHLIRALEQAKVTAARSEDDLRRWMAREREERVS